MTIYINTPGVYELTADVYDNIIIGVAGVTLNGNNFTVHGDGTGGPLINTIGILSSSQNTIVQNVNVEGFAAGVHLGGAGSKVSYVDVYECLIRGIGVAGGNGIIEHSTAGYIGGAPDWFFGATAGMAAWGDDNVIRNSNVHHLNGPYESVGYAFGGRGSLVDSLAQGTDVGGWSFGVWGGGGGTGGLTVTGTYIHSFDEAIGNAGVVAVGNSTLQGYRSAGPFTDLGNVNASAGTPNNSAYIVGTTGRDHIIGGPGNNTIVGLGGPDTLFGGAGADIFACSPNGVLSVVPDFTTGQDKISTAYYAHHNNSIQNIHINVGVGDELQATGSQGTMLFNTYNKTLYYDPDGAGKLAPELIAYLPYVATMQESDFDWDLVDPVFSSGTTAAAIDENSGANQVVYDTDATDPASAGGPSNPVTYSFGGGADDAHFTIDADDGEVRLVADPDHEAKSSYSFSVTATDASGNATTQTVTLAINDVNDQPTGIALSNNTVSEANTSGVVVGIVTVTDPDVGDDHTFTVNDARFEIVTVSGNDVLRLKAGQTLDFEATPTVPVTITATDIGGLSRQILFNLDVVDVNEPPNDPDLQTVSMELGSTEFPLDLNPAIDPEGDTLAYTVTELPAAGTVLLNGAALASGGILTLAQVQALVYNAPLVDGNGLGSQAFALKFNVSDGVNITSLVVTLTVNDASNDAKHGTPDADRLDGAAGNDQLRGYNANDILIGGIGNDFMDGGAGNDTMNGGAGDDTYIVDSAGDTIIDSNGIEIVAALTSYTLQAGVAIENLRTSGHMTVGLINLTGNETNQVIEGNASANTINGGGGVDTLHGHAGSDTYHVDNAGDKVFESVGEGTDTVVASASHVLQAGAEVELLRTNNSAATTAINLTGNGFANKLQGNAGNNALNAGAGADILQGFGGNDSYVVDNALDNVIEAAGGGTDTILTSIDFALKAGQHVEVLRTTNAAGTSAIDLTGNALANTLIGNAGDNILNGGAGKDKLTGNAGDDTFVFKTALNATTNVDMVVDFSLTDDTIQLDNAVFAGLAAGALAADAFKIGTAATDADDRIIYNSTSGALFFDSNGNAAGGSTLFARLSKGLALTSADFLVV